MSDFDELRSELSQSIKVVSVMLGRASSADDRMRMLEILLELNRIATMMDTQALTERNKAIEALVNGLSGAAKKLKDVHERAVSLTRRLQLAAKAVEALGSLAKHVAGN